MPELISQSVRPAGAVRRRLGGAVTLLLCYVGSITIFGKGPTYIGIPPVFWGEVVLAVSLIWAFRRWRPGAIPRGGTKVLAWMVVAFLLTGAAILVMGDITLDALRDSAACYYALFFFVGLVLASDQSRLETFGSFWKYCWILVIPWEALNELTGKAPANLTPRTISGGPVLSNSGSEMIAGVALGCMLLLTDRKWVRLRGAIRLPLLAAALIILALSQQRGAKIAAGGAAALVVLSVWRLSRNASSAKRNLLLAAAALSVGFIGLIAAGYDVTRLTNIDRFEEISGDTAEWRQDWWRGILAAVNEKNPLFGLGFGDPLWEYNPHLIEAGEDARTVRAPHNYNMDIFARMGYVGAFLWAVVLVVGVIRPAWRIVTATTPAEQEESRQLTFWVAVLLSLWLNASFGVLMEGPVSGIPFWLTLGIVARGASGNARPSGLRKLVRSVDSVRA